MKKYIYIFTITYSFDGDYVAKKCGSYEEAIKMLNDYLEEEIKTVENEQEYTPSVIRDSEDDVTLIYAEGYSKDDGNMNYGVEDCAYYKIFEVEI